MIRSCCQNSQQQIVQRSFSPLLSFGLYFIFAKFLIYSFVRPCSAPPDRNAIISRIRKKSPKALEFLLLPKSSSLPMCWKPGSCCPLLPPLLKVYVLMKPPRPSDSSMTVLPFKFVILLITGCWRKLFWLPPKRKLKLPKGWQLRSSSSDSSSWSKLWQSSWMWLCGWGGGTLALQTCWCSPIKLSGKDCPQKVQGLPLAGHSLGCVSSSRKVCMQPQKVQGMRSSSSCLAPLLKIFFLSGSGCRLLLQGLLCSDLSLNW